MATDATGTPTAKGIPTYDTTNDAPSGLGFNAAMAVIDGLLSDRVTTSSATLLANKLLAGDANPAFKITGIGDITWGPGGASAADVTLKRGGATTLLVSGATFEVLRANASDSAVAALVSGDSTLRWIAQADGLLKWGAGTGATDTNLYRDSANLLKTDDTFSAGTGLGSGNLAFATAVSGDTANRWYVTNTGTINFGPGNAAVDTNLYRISANLLNTDDSFRVGGNALYMGSDSGSIIWGASSDVNLYREAANILKTDDDLTVAGRVYMADLWHGSITASNTNGVQAGKKVRIYNGSGVLQGYIQIYTG